MAILNLQNKSTLQLLTTLEEVCKIYKLDYQTIFDFFIGKWRCFSLDATFLTYDRACKDPFKFWKHLKNYGTDGERITARLALRLISILASEASVERTFSQKRPVTTAKFSNSSVKLTNARLTIKWYANQKGGLDEG